MRSIGADMDDIGAVSWSTDLSGGIQRVALSHGCHPYGNGKARAVAWNLPDPVPIHREPIYTPRPDLVAKYPTLPDARQFRLPNIGFSVQKAAVDKGIAKLGSPVEFYRQLEPDAIAEHILATAGDEVREVVERIMEREYPRLWGELPPRLRELVHSRVADQLPEVVYGLTEQIGENVDQLLDIKLMVIRRIEEQPELANRIFLEVGRKELRFIVNFGFFFGLTMGIPVVGIVHLLPIWWVLPICGVLIGYTTNWIGIWMIFEPEEPRRVGPVLWQGLFPRRQREVAGVYAGIVAEDLVTLEAIGDELLNGRRGDRTRQMIETTMRGPVDRAVGRVRHG